MTLPQHKCITPSCNPCNKLRYESLELKITQDYLSKLADKNLLNGGFIDVGAHVGLWSMQLADYLWGRNKDLKSFAIEPDGRNYQQLRMNISKANVSLLNIAAWHKSAVKLCLRSNSVKHAGSYFVSEDSNNRDQLICGARLDDLVGECPINFIKIDTEGAELRVLQGATGILAANDNMLLCIEILNQQLLRFNSTANDVVKLLTKYGFQPLAERDRKILRHTDIQKSVANCFFVKGFSG
jgi:FkbM family methyltransferase